jgi:alanine dehydrogenase
MRIGIPREIKPMEGRVALVPAAAAELVRQGHEVFIEQSAGVASGHHDEAYRSSGVRILPDAASLYGAAGLIVKVKEPFGPELELLRPDHLLFSYLHLAADVALMQRLQAIGLTAVAFETVEDEQGLLPLLAPMSDIAGRLATQVGARLLHATEGGKGLLLGGLPAVGRGRVVVIGAGVAGGNAARLAARLGAEVVVFDRKRARLEAMREIGPNVTSRYPFADVIAEEIARADLLISAVLVPGSRTPHLVSHDMVRSMPAGSVIIDISIDQGGCVETIRPTTWEAPTFVVDDIVHFGVTNMPGAVPRSASQALSAALLPWLQILARDDWERNPGLSRGVNVAAGEVVHPALRQYMA